jgi:hypothetical protein
MPGFVTAKLMASKGWEVYGTHLPGQSPEEMKRSGVVPIVMDVTDERSVTDGWSRISREVGDAGLATLVNAAALAEVGGGVIEGVSMDRTRHSSMSTCSARYASFKPSFRYSERTVPRGS